MTLPEGRSGKILAVSLLALLLALAYLAVLHPLQQFYAARADEIAEKRDRLERLERVAAELPGFRAMLTQLRSSTKRTDFFLEGPSDAVAAASLQSKLKDMIGQVGGEMSSAESLPPNPRGEFRRVGVRVVMVGDLEMLVAVLNSTQQAHPPLFVDDFEIRNRNNFVVAAKT
ncbi:MAG TPA: type II secretion system protein GspM, partial [Steroidobacteraceae bacterium]|nr:type II secretion system protein GspM [Steroidobacteraceae bacterium]